MEGLHIGEGVPEARPRGPSAAPAPQPVRPAPQEVVSALLAAMEGISATPAQPRPAQPEGAEQRGRLLGRLVEESPNVVMRLDTGATVLYANPAAGAFLAACGGKPSQPLPSPWREMVREAYEFAMVRGEELEIGEAFYDVTFAPVREGGYVNVYAVDISRRRRAERAAHEAGRKLLRSLEQTIGMLARAVEKRDPSTSGHQHRVARIAVAIAGEMGLAPERIEGLRLGATIHDIGKIHTPAELLAKPGKLMSVELELIRQHPQTGYEIVKDVEFPWPVAQMVLQHHERMDGSGYPNGLKGEEILLEARILSVADVVEGMSTHRPYRPALGLEAALQEIERMRGRWLDPAAVDACLRLFRERGFALPA